MTHRIGRALLECLVVLTFVVSILAEARHASADLTPLSMTLAELSPHGDRLMPVLLGSHAHDVLSVLQQPINGALWALLVAVATAALAYLVLRVQERFETRPNASVMLGLAVAAAWPWIAHGSPVAGLVLAALAPMGVIGGMLNGADDPDDLSVSDLMLGFIGGWLVVGGFSALALLLHLKLGMDRQVAQLFCLLAGTAVAVRVQLGLGQIISFAFAVIWSLIGIAAASLDGSMTVAMACVLGIASMAVVMVRVTT